MNRPSGLLLPFFLLILISRNTEASDSVRQVMDRMTDEQKAAQLILVYYTDPAFVSDNDFGGVLIMQNMLKHPGTLKAGLARMQERSHIGVLVSIDQEGGRVNRMKRLPGWEKTPSAAEMSRWPAERIRNHAKRMARVLHDMGINMNLAPVLDPATDHEKKPTFMALKKRSFGNPPDDVVEKAGAYVEGFQSQGIISISKHFPGYDVVQNSDHEIAISRAPSWAIQSHVIPFQRLARKVSGVMLSSIIYEKYTSNPAVFSSRFTNTARNLHPDGLLITDDLWGRALRLWTREKKEDDQILTLTYRAIKTGNDLLMMTHPQKAVLMKAAIVNWMKEEPEFRSRVDDAVRRVLMLKSRMGLVKDIKAPRR